MSEFAEKTEVQTTEEEKVQKDDGDEAGADDANVNPEEESTAVFVPRVHLEEVEVKTFEEEEDVLFQK